MSSPNDRLQPEIPTLTRSKNPKDEEKEKHRKNESKKKKKDSGRSCCGSRRRNRGGDISGDDETRGALRHNFTEGEDDASHIASINSNKVVSESEEDQSCCCVCCCCSRQRGRKSQEKGKKRTSSGRCKKCCKDFLAFLFSHIGLCSIVVGYAIMGGFLFQWIESSSEIQTRQDVTHIRNTSIQRLWNMTLDFNVLFEPNWTMLADNILRDFQLQVYDIVKEQGWDGRGEEDEELMWSFASSMLYSVTVITTIGYGHIAPKTALGRLVTMFYALIGIPLTLLCLANIGSCFGNCFRLLYKHTCDCLKRVCCPGSKTKAVAKTPDNKKESGKRSTSDASTVPRRIVRSEAKNKSGDGSRQALRSNDPVDVEQGQGVRLEETSKRRPTGRDGEGRRQAATVTTQPRPEPAPRRRCDSRDFDPDPDHRIRGGKDDRRKSLKDEIRVPMFVSLMIIALYIFGGAVLFSLWEKEWDYLIGSYFCFITLSTIGFGDFVFGMDSSLDNNEKLIICALYLVLGLSIIAMCFDLMQEEVRLKFRWLGYKLGIIE